MFWKLYRPEPYGGHYDCGEKFHYCDKFATDSPIKRKRWCNGKYKENKV